jgi:hypothetical protein
VVGDGPRERLGGPPILAAGGSAGGNWPVVLRVHRAVTKTRRSVEDLPVTVDLVSPGDDYCSVQLLRLLVQAGRRVGVDGLPVPLLPYAGSIGTLGGPGTGPYGDHGGENPIG